MAKTPNVALERLAHATTNKDYSPASPLQALVRRVRNDHDTFLTTTQLGPLQAELLDAGLGAITGCAVPSGFGILWSSSTAK